MDEKIISFETAKSFKEKGFDLPTPHCYVHVSESNSYELELFSFLLGGEGFLSEVYEQEKHLRNLDFKMDTINNESETYFNYNQDIRKLLVRIYNGEEYMNDPKSHNMNVDSYTYDNETYEECENQKNTLPNYNDGDFDFCVYQDVVSAPTQSLLQKWLREEHDIRVFVISTILPDGYSFKIIYYRKDVNDLIDHFLGEYKTFETYEEALEQGLLEGLKLI